MYEPPITVTGLVTFLFVPRTPMGQLRTRSFKTIDLERPDGPIPPVATPLYVLVLTFWILVSYVMLFFGKCVRQGGIFFDILDHMFRIW
jgi:hypothetical protein